MKQSAPHRQKVRMSEDAWNTRDPDRVVLAYTPDTRGRNRAEFPVGRDEVRRVLTRKWAREPDYRLIKELRACAGKTSKRQAIFTALSPKSCWHLSKNLATQIGMINGWLASQGLLSIRDLWIKAHGQVCACRVRLRHEPPGADPPAGWCGGRG